MAAVGVLMFGGGVAAAEFLPQTTPGLPLTGTQCATDHCGPATYNPRLVADAKGVFQPSCPGIAALGHVGAEKLRIEDATFTSMNAPLQLSDTTSSSETAHVDAFIAAADRNAVVSTAAVGGHSSVTLVLFRCSMTLGLAEQFVHIPIDTSQMITLETIRVRPPAR